MTGDKPISMFRTIVGPFMLVDADNVHAYKVSGVVVDEFAAHI